MFIDYLYNVFFNQYFLLFLTAALGYLLGKVKIKSFTLGSTGGIFTGIFIGWLMVTIAKTVPETDSHFATAQKLIGDSSTSGIVDSGFMNFFLIIFIAAAGLGVGRKIRKVLNMTGVKLVVIGVIIPVVSMVLTFGCLKLAPSLMGSNYSGYSISGMYSGSMTNTAAFGNSMAVINNNAEFYKNSYAEADIDGKVDTWAFLFGKTMTDEEGVRAALENQYKDELSAIADETAKAEKLQSYVTEFMSSHTEEEITAKRNSAEMYAVIAVLAAKSAGENATDEEKGAAIAAAKAQGADYIPAELSDDQANSLMGKFKGTVSGAYAVAFPVGTIIIIILISILAALSRKQRESEGAFMSKHGNASSDAIPRQPAGKPGIFFNALTFGLVIFLGYLLGMIKIPLGNGTNFSFSFVGGVLIMALVVANLPLGKEFEVDPLALGFIREFGLLFFMSIIGLSYGYLVVHSILGSGLVVAIMSAVVEIIAVAVALLLGRIMKLRWGLLAGAICGGCTSTVGLGTALVTMDSDEPGMGFGVSQPFAILANVLLIAWFHSQFFL